METLETIFSRRSVRQFRLGDKLTEEQLTTLLRAGMQAPSAGNAQDWELVVVRDRSTLNAIMNFHPYAQMLKNAGAAMIVCGNLTTERYPGHWVQDCSAVSENILLAVHDLGLGSVWVGVYPNNTYVEELQTLLHLPKDVIPLNILPIGYPEKTPEPENRYVESKVHWEKW